MSARRVQVKRNRYRPDRVEHPWLVTCDYCAGDGGFFGVALGVNILGWAVSWEAAQQYAATHAGEHLARRCPVCSHVPLGKP